MNPPFSSKPISAFYGTILRDTSTLPTLVRITLDFVFVASVSIAELELRQVTILDRGYLFRM